MSSSLPKAEAIDADDITKTMQACVELMALFDGLCEIPPVQDQRLDRAALSQALHDLGGARTDWDTM